MNKIIVALVLLAIGFTAKAQNDNDIKLAALPYYTFGKGVGLTSPDSIFKLNIRFRMQNRATYLESETDKNGVEAMVRRMRLKFDGYVGDPKFVYVVQLSFAPGDVGVIEDGDNINIIRDAVVFYRPNEHWNIGFGQTKLPGNRQRINSSGALQLTDRTINNASFNIDRDFGLQVYYLNERPDNFSYNIKTAISTGEGRNWTKLPETGLAYTARLELYPFGAFTDNGTFFEGDIAREPTPKLMLSGVYHYNEGARRTRGTLGLDLFEQRDLTSLLFDAIVKYNGWAFQTAYMKRMADNPITYNPEDSSEFRYVVAGEGFDAQASYIFPNNYEIIGRYSNQKPNNDVALVMPETNQYSLGITKYIWEHSLKLQAELTKTDFTLNNTIDTDSWYLRFQVEIGI
ncbi:phosphate-selective porin O and P [Formosa agariphila KMM 3901]|uniref:Phosphate-selective porin O and P n=1 Tax=Formosa agariphila (strain DSM 15362 / KCTC 12365 / LMG 23005 / KMM 3901 / M-2Alg 35-1) TaxID=1347342 RepID=T2KNI4_FORAG|nr:porin [Formosa agariphila]CDF80432.1 phosphate-selective porin O and P [Formosa agariphila KMM 3901]